MLVPVPLDCLSPGDAVSIACSTPSGIFMLVTVSSGTFIRGLDGFETPVSITGAPIDIWCENGLFLLTENELVEISLQSQSVIRCTPLPASAASRAGPASVLTVAGEVVRRDDTGAWEVVCTAERVCGPYLLSTDGARTLNGAVVAEWSTPPTATSCWGDRLCAAFSDHITCYSPGRPPRNVPLAGASVVVAGSAGFAALVGEHWRVALTGGAGAAAGGEVLPTPAPDLGHLVAVAEDVLYFIAGAKLQAFSLVPSTEAEQQAMVARLEAEVRAANRELAEARAGSLAALVPGTPKGALLRDVPIIAYPERYLTILETHGTDAGVEMVVQGKAPASVKHVWGAENRGNDCWFVPWGTKSVYVVIDTTTVQCGVTLNIPYHHILVSSSQPTPTEVPVVFHDSPLIPCCPKGLFSLSDLCLGTVSGSDLNLYAPPPALAAALAALASPPRLLRAQALARTQAAALAVEDSLLLGLYSDIPALSQALVTECDAWRRTHH